MREIMKIHETLSLSLSLKREREREIHDASMSDTRKNMDLARHLSHHPQKCRSSPERRQIGRAERLESHWLMF